MPDDNKTVPIVVVLITTSGVLLAALINSCAKAPTAAVTPQVSQQVVSPSTRTAEPPPAELTPALPTPIDARWEGHWEMQSNESEKTANLGAYLNVDAPGKDNGIIALGESGGNITFGTERQCSALYSALFTATSNPRIIKVKAYNPWKHGYYPQAKTIYCTGNPVKTFTAMISTENWTAAHIRVATTEDGPELTYNLAFITK